MGSVCLYPLDNLGHAWEQAGSPPDPLSASLHAGRDFSKEQQGRCQIQKEFGPNSLEIPAYGLFLYSPSFSLGHKDLQGAWPQPASLAALPPHTTSQRQEFSQEIPLSPSLLPLLQASKELPLEIRSPFKCRCLHYLEFGFINYLHLVSIKKVEQCRCPDFGIGLGEKHQICGISIVSLDNGPSEAAGNYNPDPIVGI